MTPFQLIIKHYRQNIPFRNFAKVLSEGIPKPITYQSLANWENRGTQPEYHMFLPIALHYQDWRRDFALDCLAALAPEVYPPVSQFAEGVLS